MTIIVEDGTGVSGANSYVTEAELTSYATSRGVTLTGSPEPLLHQSMDWVEMQSYKGSKTSSTQDLQWPRTGVYIDNVLIDSDVIPKELKYLQLRVAIDIDQGSDPNAVEQQSIKSESVDGAVSTTYQDNSYQSRISSQASALLSKLSGGSSMWQFDVTRG